MTKLFLYSDQELTNTLQDTALLLKQLIDCMHQDKPLITSVYVNCIYLMCVWFIPQLICVCARLHKHLCVVYIDAEVMLHMKIHVCLLL